MIMGIVHYSAMIVMDKISSYIKWRYYKVYYTLKMEFE